MHFRINISVSPDTLDCLDQYALEKHTSRSQAVTDLVWATTVRNSQVRGQTTMDEIIKNTGKSKKMTKS